MSIPFKTESTGFPAPSLSYYNLPPGRPDGGKVAVRRQGAVMKPATFDGSSNWLNYKAHFEVKAELNSWYIRPKGLYSAASLRGQAQVYLGI